MKKIFSFLLLFMMPSLAFAEATCTYNGENIPCDQMPTWFWVFIVAFLVIGLSFFIFWLWMLIDAIKYQEEHKVLWLLLILLTNAMGALVYYFAARRHREKIDDPSQPTPPKNNSEDSTPMGAKHTEDFYFRQ